ncbi:MAG: hypothetical protein LBK99_01370, partial [Opitutaceae bacterium]|nr:hypothetical protein [Opitutaceae bacterium]
MSLNVAGAWAGTESAITWVDFYLKPVFGSLDALPDPAEVAPFMGAGFVLTGSDGSGGEGGGGEGEVYSLDGNGMGGGRWVPSGHVVTLEDGVSTDWMRISWRIDYGQKRQDLYVDGILRNADLGFVDT